MVSIYRTVGSVPKVTKKEKPVWGRAIAAQRTRLGKSLVDVENETNGELYQALLYRLENGKKDPLTLTVRQFSLLLQVLGWTVRDWQEHTGFEVPAQPSELSRFRANAFPINTRPMPVLGVAAGGKPYEYPVPRSLWRPGGAVFMVEGNSMDDGTERAIRDGDMVLVDTTLTHLQTGKLYVLEIIGDGYTIKQARKLNGEWVWLPFNPEHPALHPKEVRVVGQVYKVLRAGDV